MAQESARAKGFTACRRVLTKYADTKGVLGVSSLSEAFEESPFSDGLFILCNPGYEESFRADEFLININSNLKNEESHKAFIQLLESCVHLASPGNNIRRPEMRKILGSKGLAGTIIDAIIANKGGHGSRRVSVDEVIGFISNMTKNESRNTITLEDLEKFTTTFNEYNKGKEGLNKDAFAKMVSAKNKFFIEGAFRVFDKRKSGCITLDDYQETLGELVGDNKEGALKFLFRVYDQDGDGHFRYEDLSQVIKASMEESGMKFDTLDLDDLVWALWEDAGLTETSSVMSYTHWKMLLEKHPEFTDGLANSIASWCTPRKYSSLKQQKKATSFNMSKYWSTNSQLFIFLILFFGANLGLFLYRLVYFYEFRNHDGSFPNVWVMMARANGISLNFNSCFILVFILRHTVTLMRKIGLVTVLPLDHHVFLHKLTGIVLLVHGWWHTISHLVNFARNVVENPVEFAIENEAYLGPVATIGFNRPPKGQRYSYWEWLFTTKPGLFGLTGGEANVTGVVLILVLTIMVISSMPFVRRSGHFEIFYFTHLLYIVYFISMIFHAPSCWTWMSVPMGIFVLEGIYRLVSQFSDTRGQSNVIAGIVLPSKVTGLVIKKPPNFRHVPGDWVFVKIPEIAMFEWHPFTISSAPEDEETFTLHIRGAGGWTNKLYEYFEEESKLFEQGKSRARSTVSRFQRSVQRSFRRQLRMTGQSRINHDPDQSETEVLARVETRAITSQYGNFRRMPTIVRYSASAKKRARRIQETDSEKAERTRIKTLNPTNLMKPLTIYIDGPFGAPASNIFRAKHAVLIATGIGVTPFSSILQSIMHRFWANKRECPNCNHKWTDSVQELFNLTKVDFFWINRDQRSFEWFVHLMSQLEIEQAEKGGAMERFLDMHMYMTSALKKTDMRAVCLQLALDVLHKKEKRDLVTGLKSRTRAGRPNWDQVFKSIQAQNKGPVTVFYCGNPHLAKILQKKCEEFGFAYRKEVF